MVGGVPVRRGESPSFLTYSLGSVNAVQWRTAGRLDVRCIHVPRPGFPPMPALRGPQVTGAVPRHAASEWQREVRVVLPPLPEGLPPRVVPGPSRRGTGGGGGQEAERSSAAATSVTAGTSSATPRGNRVPGSPE